MTERILCVDDDPNILHGYQRALQKRFCIEAALGAEEGLAAVVNHGPYAVVVADMRMPGMNGIQLLAKVKQHAPETVRMMLTGNADLQTAIQAVNDGCVFRFMSKPCPVEAFANALEAGVTQYRLVIGERELLSMTLRGSVKLLTDVLSLVNPTAFGRTSRVRGLVSAICRELKTDRLWVIEIAAMLCQIGYVAVPEKTLSKVYNRQPLSEAEAKALGAHAEVGRTLLANIPRLEEVADIIASQDRHYGNRLRGVGARDNEDVPLGSRILKVALDFDTLVSGGISNELALAEMRDRQHWYDPRVLAALQRILQITTALVVRQVPLHRLPDGVILADDVRSIDGTRLFAKGQEVTPPIRARLRNYAVNVGIQEPVKIFVSAEMAGEYEV